MYIYICIERERELYIPLRPPGDGAGGWPASQPPVCASADQRRTRRAGAARLPGHQLGVCGFRRCAPRVRAHGGRPPLSPRRRGGNMRAGLRNTYWMAIAQQTIHDLYVDASVDVLDYVDLIASRPIRARKSISDMINLCVDHVCKT